MGQVNSASNDANVENGKTGLIERATEELNAASANAGERNEDHVKCVKARIDMLIEDCLNLEAYSDSEPDQAHKEVRQKRPVESDKNSEPIAIKKPDENLIKDYLDGAREGSQPVENSGSENNEGGSKDDGDSVKSLKNDDSESDKQNEDKRNLDTDPKAPKEHTKVSDLISEMVNTEINSSNLAQLQKRTITTFNTFIDKVLDTTFQQDTCHEEPKTSEPGILQLVTESFLPARDQPRQISDKTDPDSASHDQAKPQTSKITFKDHIEKLLEQTIQENETEKMDKVKKEIKREKFDAQGLLNDIIVQGLKMNDSGGSRSQLKVETQRPIPDVYSHKHVKPNDRNGARSHMNDMYGQKSPSMVSHMKRENNDTKSNRSVPKDQGIPTDTRYNKEMYMNWGRGEMRADPRDMYNYSANSRRHSMSDRSREVISMGSGNKHMAANVRGAETTSAFQQLHPQFGNFASPEYYKAAYAAIGNLGHGHSPDLRGFPPRENKQLHARDCMCALCVQSAQTVRSKVEQPVVEHVRDKRSPNVPPHLAGLPPHFRDHPSMLRTCFMPYQASPKILPHHQPVSSPKESSNHLVPPTDMGRRQSISEGSQSPLYLYKRAEDNTQPERPMAKSGPPISRPPSTGQRYVRTLSSQSGSSDSSDAPLDLSVKKPKIDPSRHRSASFTASTHKRMAAPMNSFIRHLENSVDKHWQEMCSPSNSPSNSSSPKNQLLYADGRAAGQGSNRGCSPGAISPSAPVSMLHNRHLPSPHYVGGITVGQPLVNLERNSQTTPDGHYPPVSQYENLPQSQFSQGQVENSRAADNISKHEPIQNIIGNHDPNDILYLICRLCTQTYGSPYAFRKHFRSNHGFEPRADHTIVQTISATKMALNVPQPVDVQGMVNARKSPHEKSRMSPLISQPQQKKTPRESPVALKPPASPVDTRSQHGSESGESDQTRPDCDKNETKCLECPECGKSFQLNDFGSYKRHCRQHGNLLTSGPYTCTDCHLHFPDQKTLREHYLLHVKESPLEEKRNIDSNSGDVKVESHKSAFSCVKCNVHFDKLEAYTKHVASHDLPEEVVKVEKQTRHAKEVNSAQMDISVNPSSSLSIVKQAAESMTSQMCPDSSWDNVVKGVATSNKPDDVLESGDYKNSPKSDSNKFDDRSESSPAAKSVDMGSDASDANTQDSSDVGIYKHKKFFHHRKRPNPSVLPDSGEPKQAKLSVDSNSASGGAVSNSSKVLSVNNDSCDSSGFSDTGSNTSSVTDSSVAGEKKEEKTASKTEARHNLPFVWDRPTRSQKKL